MQRSTDRILSTHVGSLYRTPELLELYVPRQRGEPYLDFVVTWAAARQARSAGAGAT